MADPAYDEQPQSQSSEENVTPWNPLDPALLLPKLKRMYGDGEKKRAKWIKEAKQDYDFVAGHQWTDDEIAQLEDDGRPRITFDRLGPIVDVVCGLEANNREEIVTKPRDLTDGPAASTLTALVEWCRDQTDAEDEESMAFRDVVTGGMAWLEARLDEEYDEKFLCEEHIDPFEMGWDPAAKKRNLTDARFLYRVREISRDEAEAMFPEADPLDIDASWARTASGSSHESPHVQPLPYEAYKIGGGNVGDALAEDVVIVEFQWCQRMPMFVVGDPMTGEQTEIDGREMATLTARGVPVQVLDRKSRKVWYRAFVGRDILEAGELPVQAGPTWKCLTGKYDRKEGIWYGLVRPARDPQRYANKWLAMSLEILASGAKGGLIYEEDAFDDPHEVEDKWANPREIIKASAGAISGNKIQERPQAQYPSGWDKMLTLAMQSIRDSTGINMEILGMRDANQPGVLEAQRKQSAITILAWFFDGLRQVRKDLGQLTVDYILAFMPKEQMARILGPEQQEGIAALDQVGIKQYDIVVDEAPSSPNAKERGWSLVSPLLPQLAQFDLPPQIWAEIVRYTPLPSSLAEKLAEHLEQLGQPDPEKQAMQQRMQQLEMEKTASETQENLAGAEYDRAKAATEFGNLKLKGAQGIIDAITELANQQQQRSSNGGV